MATSATAGPTRADCRSCQEASAWSLDGADDDSSPDSAPTAAAGVSTTCTGYPTGLSVPTGQLTLCAPRTALSSSSTRYYYPPSPYFPPGPHGNGYPPPPAPPYGFPYAPQVQPAPLSGYTPFAPPPAVLIRPCIMPQTPRRTSTRPPPDRRRHHLTTQQPHRSFHPGRYFDPRSSLYPRLLPPQTALQFFPPQFRQGHQRLLLPGSMMLDARSSVPGYRRTPSWRLQSFTGLATQLTSPSGFLPWSLTSSCRGWTTICA